MKKSIITIMLAFVALAGVAQTKPSAKKPQQNPPPETQYTIQMSAPELQQLFTLVNIAKNLTPYSKQKAEDKVNTIQFIDDFAEKLGGKIKEVAIDSVQKHN